MDNALGGSARAPRTLIRSGLVMTDLAALPLLALGFAGVAGLALAALGIAAGGLNFLLGLRFLDFFPVFPVAARILSGFTLLAFAALLFASALPLWNLYRAAWRRFWSWHGSAWAGVFAVRTARTADSAADSAATGLGKGARASMRLIVIAGLLFLGLLAVTFALMMLQARGPFWHAWRWFT
jgi:hypothetical protein